MEEKNQIKISLSTTILLVSIIVIIILTISFCIFNKKNTTNSNLNDTNLYETENVENQENYNTLCNEEDSNCNTSSYQPSLSDYFSQYDKKPIIYLYPQEKTELTISLGIPDKITCSYPKYSSGWNIIANPNGNLIDLDSNKNLYALYYESENIYNFEIEKDGFIVSSSDVSTFLEEKLSILGLTDREAEEFIVYWLPKLQENKYNYIRFATIEEINKNMPINFSVEPDTFIRVLMTYKGLESPIDIKEQQLKTPSRTGFVAVEWGGTEIN